MVRRQRERRSILKTLFIGIIFAIPVIRTFLNISSSEKYLNELNIIYDMAANQLPTVRGELKPRDSFITNSGSDDEAKVDDDPLSSVGGQVPLLESDGRATDADEHAGESDQTDIQNDAVVETNATLATVETKIIVTDIQNKTTIETNKTLAAGITDVTETDPKNEKDPSMSNHTVETNTTLATVGTNITVTDSQNKTTIETNKTLRTDVTETDQKNEKDPSKSSQTVETNTTLVTGGTNISVTDSQNKTTIETKKTLATVRTDVTETDHKNEQDPSKSNQTQPTTERGSSVKSETNGTTQNTTDIAVGDDNIAAEKKKNNREKNNRAALAGTEMVQAGKKYILQNTTVMSSSHSGTNNIVEFERQDGVVIVTKLHGPHQLTLLEQSMCLLHYAYNNRVNYDIVVFTTDPIDEKDLVNLREKMAPAKFTVVVDNDGLQNEIKKLSPLRRKNFLSRCNVTSPEELTWWSVCRENDDKGRIAYNWQAEFRSWHMWRHPALAPYQYMMWLDTDGFCTKVWDRDPVAIAMQNKLAVFMGNFPMGRGQGVELQDRIKRAFNDTLCSVGLNDGHFQVKKGSQVREGKFCSAANVRLVHGFFHITNLDFYRSDPAYHWAKTMIGDCFLCRRFDDQIAVTVAPAMLAPDRAWDMYSHDVQLNIAHNFRMDGKKKDKTGGFKVYWKKNAETRFPEAWGKCKITDGG